MLALLYRDQRAHVQSNQLGRGHANELGHAAIDPQNVSGMVMHNDEVADGVENLDPLGIRLGHPAEKTGIVQGNRGISCDRLQQLVIAPDEFAATVGDQQQANQLVVGPLESNCRQILPAQTRGERLSDEVACRSIANDSPLTWARSVSARFRRLKVPLP